MNIMLKNSLSAYKEYRMYRYGFFLTLFLYVNSVMQTSRFNIRYYHYTFQDMIISYIGTFLGIIIFFLVVGQLISNSKTFALLTDEQKNVIAQEQTRIVLAVRGIIVGGFLWFFLLIMSVFSTDSCGTDCFAGDDIVGIISFYLYPFISIITFVVVMYLFLVRNFTHIEKIIRTGFSPIWTLSPLLFLISMLIFAH